MKYEGIWLATSDENRKLVFEANGVGYVQVETEHFPYFRISVGEFRLKVCSGNFLKMLN
jgi:hypothetical protein